MSASNPPPRRIALLAGSYDQHRDGVSVYIENLLVALLREPGAGRDFVVEVFGCRDAMATLREVLKRHVPDRHTPDRLVYRTVDNNGALARTLQLSWRVTRQGPFDAIVLPNLQPLPLPGRKLSVLHDLTYQVAHEHFSHRRFYYMDWLTRFRLRSDTAFGVISRTTQMHLFDYYPSAAHKTLAYLPNGLPETKLGERPDRAAVRDKLRAQPTQLLFCGRLNRLKGVDRLLAFADKLDEQASTADGPAPILHLVGKTTPETRALLDGRSFQRLQLRQHGFLEDDDLNRLYRECGFALFLSRNEGFGLPVIEAIWSGVVPLVSDIPVFAEVLGAAFPRFGDQPADRQAMHDFITRLGNDAEYREHILKEMEGVLDTHRDGYGTSARAVLAFASASDRRGTAASGESPPRPLRDSE